MGKAMSKLMALAIENNVNKLFELEKERIIEKLFDGSNETDNYERIYARVIYNAMIISVDMSVELVIDTLLRLGVVGPENEKEIRKSIMSIVQAEKPESD